MNADRERHRYLVNRPRKVPLGYEDYAGDKQFATTLARGIELLRCFNAGDTMLSNGELAERTSLPKATISRLTYTLVILGYLKLSPKYGKYQLGSALISATYPLMASIGLRQHARQMMNELADETGADVSMGIRDRLNIVLIETSRSRNRARVAGAVADTGLAIPIAGSAIGRAWLAGSDAETRAAVLNEIRVKTPEDAARYDTDIQQAIKDHRRQGFCSVDGDLVAGIQAVGVPYGHISTGDLVVFNCAFQQPTPQEPHGNKGLLKVAGPRLLQMVRTLRESRFQ